MGRRSYESHLGRRGRYGCIRVVLALVLVASVSALIYLLAIRPMLTRAVADEIVPVPSAPAAAVPTLIPPANSQNAALTAVVGQAGSVLPTVIAALPTGKLVITDADLNGFIAARPQDLAPLDSASVSFSAGKARAQVSAFGVSSGAALGLAAQDGRIVVTDVTVDPPLSYLLSGADLAAALADRLNAELVAQGRSVSDLRIEEGRLILVLR